MKNNRIFLFSLKWRFFKGYHVSMQLAPTEGFKMEWICSCSAAWHLPLHLPSHPPSPRPNPFPSPTSSVLSQTVSCRFYYVQFSYCAVFQNALCSAEKLIRWFKLPQTISIPGSRYNTHRLARSSTQLSSAQLRVKNYALHLLQRNEQICFW